MTIQLPDDLERSVRSEVLNGRHASEDVVVAAIVREHFRRREAEASPMQSDSDPVLGCLRSDAELMDEVVAEAYRQRREEPWREFDL